MSHIFISPIKCLNFLISIYSLKAICRPTINCFTSRKRNLPTVHVANILGPIE